jgi:hypothetical protein
MATKISIQKGSVATLSVVVSYLVAALSLWASKKLGMAFDDAMQTQLTIAGTALLAGAITGVLNWWKHRKPIVSTPPAP